MTKTVAVLICFILAGCATVGPPEILSVGMAYVDGKNALEKAGFVEKNLEWAIVVPDGEVMYTYYLSKKTALFVFVREETKSVSNMVKYDNLDKPVAYRKWTEAAIINVDDLTSRE